MWTGRGYHTLLKGRRHIDGGERTIPLDLSKGGGGGEGSIPLEPSKVCVD